jgi:deoxyuridine 5'-triphosphate nucleotidohydrolase
MSATELISIENNILNKLINSNNSINLNINYFKNIDTNDKAYIIGYICAQFEKCINKEENTLLLYSYSIDNILNIIQYFINDYNKYINNYKDNIYSFYYIKFSNKNIIDDLCKHLLDVDDKLIFPNFENDDLKISFIKGFFDKNGYIEDNRYISNVLNKFNNNSSSLKCKIEYYDYHNNIIDNFKYMIDIPFNIKKCVNEYIYNSYEFTDINVIDFLGKIYKHDNKLHNVILYNYYLKIIDYNSLPYCKITIKDNNAIIPSKVRESDVGYDLTIIKKVKDFNNTTTLYDTGISINIQPGYYAEIVARSSLSKSGYILTNSVGIIDPGYRGNLFIALSKIDKESPDIQLPFKCCQLIIKKQVFVNLYIDDTDDTYNTNRNSGGFGSTGQ